MGACVADSSNAVSFATADVGACVADSSNAVSLATADVGACLALVLLPDFANVLSNLQTTIS